MSAFTGRRITTETGPEVHGTLAGKPTSARFDPNVHNVARPSDVETDEGRDASPVAEVLSVPARAGPVGITTSDARIPAIIHKGGDWRGALAQPFVVEIPPDAARSHQIGDLLHSTGYP